MNVAEAQEPRLFYERERNRALNQMVAGIAHEIQPSYFHQGICGTHSEEEGQPQFQEQMARYLPEEPDRINSMVRNLIDYAKPQSSKRQQVDVHEVIAAVP